MKEGGREEKGGEGKRGGGEEGRRGGYSIVGGKGGESVNLYAQGATS